MSILSIQSHVSYGHVGNSGSVFILQRMGFDVWPIYTVLYSNHPGYGHFDGKVVDSKEIKQIILGIERLSVFNSCKVIIGGYLGSVKTGPEIISACDSVKTYNPNCLFFCDPVMGDADKGVYVSQQIIDFYKEIGLFAADFIKPNAFELSVLANHDVYGPHSAAQAARKLIIKYDLKAVLVSSVPILSSSCSRAKENIGSMIVTASHNWLIQTPLLPIEQRGAGDALMALFVGNFLSNGGDLLAALNLSVSSIFSIINESLRLEEEELSLIRQQNEILNPSFIFKASVLE